MQGLAEGLAKQTFSEAIESLKLRDGGAAWEQMKDASASGLADAAVGLVLLKIFAARSGEYDELIQELEDTVRRLAELPTTFEISGYGYYLLGRCYAFLAVKKQRFQSDFLKKVFRNKLMEKAAYFYMQSLARDTSFVETAFELGLIYDIGLNSSERAIEAYRMVLELRSDHGLAQNFLAGRSEGSKQLDDEKLSSRYHLLSPDSVASVPELKPAAVHQPDLTRPPVHAYPSQRAQRWS